MVLSSECLSTYITWEWSLISVSSLMNHEVVGLGELSVAELADEPLLLLGVPASLGEVVGPHEV